MNALMHDWSWVQAHGTALLTAAGAVLIAVVIAAVFLVARRAPLASVLRGVAIPLVLLWEAQGVYGVALRLHAVHELAYAFAGVMSAVLLGLASYADKHFKEHGNLGPNGRRMWYVAVFMGAVVAANAGSLTGVGLRLLLPLFSLVMFQAPYLPDEPAGHKAKQGTWRITPRRIAVSLGLIDPADTDLSAVHAERTIRLLTRHAAGYHRGLKPLRRWHGWRFERLALMADDTMIAEAALRVRRVHEGLASTAPVPVTEAAPVPIATGTDGAAPVPVAMTIEVPPAMPIAAPTVGPTGAPPEAPMADTPHEGAAGAHGDPDPGTPRDARRPAPPSAVAKVLRIGAGPASDDQVRAAIREMGADGSKVTVYRVGKELKGPKGGISDKRAARLLAEVQAEVPDRTVVPIGSAKSVAGE